MGFQSARLGVESEDKAGCQNSLADQTSSLLGHNRRCAIRQVCRFEWIRGVPAFSAMPREHVEQIVDWMLQQDLLWDEAGILGIGPAGEKQFGRRHFMELLSVFLSAPLFSVLHGRQELGYVDELTFLGKQEGARVLLLGGRAWKVTHIDWSRKVAYVEATDESGQSRWKGAGRILE